MLPRQSEHGKVSLQRAFSTPHESSIQYTDRLPTSCQCALSSMSRTYVLPTCLKFHVTYIRPAKVPFLRHSCQVGSAQTGYLRPARRTYRRSAIRDMLLPFFLFLSFFFSKFSFQKIMLKPIDSQEKCHTKQQIQIQKNFVIRTKGIKRKFTFWVIRILPPPPHTHTPKTDTPTQQRSNKNTVKQ